MYLEQKLSYYISQAKTIQTNDFKTTIRIAILSSFTIDGLAEVIKVKCAEKQVKTETFVAGYNQYNQEILNTNSNLYKFNPDITILILDTRAILGNLFYLPYSISADERKQFVNNKSDELLNLAKTFVKNSKSKLIISNFVVPTYSSYGICENKSNFGLQETIINLNSILIKNIANMSPVFMYDLNSFVTYYGEKNVFDYKKYFTGDIQISFDHIPFLANQLMGFVKAILGLNKKCIVLDLDNTLWGGVVGEDGFEGIKLGDDAIGKTFVEFQKTLLGLYERGILLAINSKNNFDDAIRVIKDHPNMILREEHFASMKINWNDKVSNMKEIAAELNIGMDSFVFFDDDPVNQEFVRTNLPEVLTVDLPNDPAQFTTILKEINDFNVLNITEEDKKRGQMYLQQRKITELQKTSQNIDDFLKQLNINVIIKKADEFTIPRISQLTLKTNQFNLTTKRYQEEDIRKFSQDNKKLVGCARVTDKFGDNGITGAFIINKDNNIEWSIDTFLLSCRVMGRGVENGILDHIIKIAKNEGIQKIRGWYMPTTKNKPSENFLHDYGFNKDGDSWVLQINNSIK